MTALQFLTNRYVDNVWRHIGIHLLAAGWVLSSAQLQEYLLKSIAVRVGLTFIFALMLWVHWVVNWPIYKHIKNLETQIRRETKEPLSDFYGISKSLFFGTRC